MSRITFVLLCLLAGCSMVGTTVRLTPVRAFVAKDNPTAYRIAPNGDPGDSIGTLPYHTGDSLIAVGSRINKWKGTIHYMVMRDRDTLYVQSPDVQSEDDYIYYAITNKIHVPKSSDPATWARATVYITKHSDMKIQTASENIVQTYNPLEGTQTGYTVTRIPGINEVEYEVTCISKSNYVGTGTLERQMAFYMLTGHEYVGILSR